MTPVKVDGASSRLVTSSLLLFLKRSRARRRVLFSLPVNHLDARRGGKKLFSTNVNLSNGFSHTTHEPRQSTNQVVRADSEAIGHVKRTSISDVVLIESVNEAETKLMRQNASRLLQLPVGQMDPSVWYDAEETLKWWISQRTEESIHTSIDLLNRFVRETERNDAGVDNLSMFLDQNLIVTFLVNWGEVWKQKEISWTPTRVLSEMDKLGNKAPEVRGLQLTSILLSYIINALLVRINPMEAAEVADQLLSHFLDRRTRPSGVSCYLINSVLNVWSKSGRADAVERAEDIFSRVRTSPVGKNLDIISFNTMLDVYAQAGLAERAEALLEAMAKDYLLNPRRVAPDKISFATTASAWSRSGDPQAPEKIAELMYRLMDPYDPLGKLSVTPDTEFFNSLLSAWARSGRENAGEEAYHVLTEMQDPNLYDAAPDKVTYATVADAYAKNGNPQAAEKVAGELIQAYRESHDERLRPTIHIFTSVVEAWLNSDHPNKEHHAQGVLEDTRKLNEEGILLEAADTWMYNLMLCSVLSSSGRSGAKKGHQFLEWMKNQATKGLPQAAPNGFSYTSVICACLRETGGLRMAEHLLLEAFLNKRIALELKTPARVIHALAKADAAVDADVWLNRVFDGSEKRVFGDSIPSDSLLSAVIGAWFRVARTYRDAGSRAEHLVRRMMMLYKKGLAMEPDPGTFRVLPHIWLRTGSSISIDRAYEVLKFMRRKADEGDPRMIPDEGMYGAIIHSYAISHRPYEAEKVQQEMLNDYLNDNQRAKPHVESFNNVLRGWTMGSDIYVSLAKVEAKIQQMKDLSKSRKLDVHPNRRTYQYAIQLSMNGERTKQIFDEMKQCYLSGNDHCKPSGLSYRHVIFALCDDGNPELAERYLRDACTDFQKGSLQSPPPNHWFDKVITSWERKKNVDKTASVLQGVLSNTSTFDMVTESVRRLRSLQEETTGIELETTKQ